MGAVRVTLFVGIRANIGVDRGFWRVSDAENAA